MGSIRFATLGVLAIGISSASAIDFSLRPVGASKPHVLAGDQITLFEGGGTVTFEVRLSNWDPDRDGMPSVRSYQMYLDLDSFDSGSEGTVGSLVSCAHDSDCPPGIRCYLSREHCLFPHDAWITTSRPDFLFYNLDYQPIIGLYLESVIAASLWNHTDSVTDAGAPAYLASLRLDVSDDAYGLFTIELVSDRTFAVDPNTVVIAGTSVTPAHVLVLRDCNRNKIDDTADIATGASEDCNSNGKPDECEVDCNDSGAPDDCDIASGSSQDIGGNGTPDECDPDCNGNGVADDGDIALGNSADCNDDDVPDDCELGGDEDCDGDSLSDLCELFTGVSLDCNANLIPDDCDIGSGASADCTADGIPDECDADCNRNGVSDLCDIALGNALDANLDHVPDECLRGIWLVPVAADVHHVLKGNEITVPRGVRRVTLDLRIAGWARRADPATRLVLYTAVLLPSGFTSGLEGELSLARLACETDLDCFSYTGCENDGLCEPAAAFWFDPTHPNAAFRSLSPISAPLGYLPAPALQTATLKEGEIDVGADRYAGTIELEVSPDASGTFLLKLDPDWSYWGTSRPVGRPALGEAYITVIADCNENNASDELDIADGTSGDADGNGVPDECELAVPFVASIGSRYLAVTPQEGTDPIAIEVSSAQFPCVRRFIVPGPGGHARLSDSPVFLSPQQWGTVEVSGAEVMPGTTYQVRGRLTDGRWTWASSTKTWRWGDVDGNAHVNVIDLSELIDGVKAWPITSAMRAKANLWDCDGAGEVDVMDIGAAVDANRGLAFPCAVPCQ